MREDSAGYDAGASESASVVRAGDSLFPGGPGKAIGVDNFRSLMTDLENKVFARFPDDTIVLPGHGLPITLGAERPHLPEWWARGW